MEEDERSQLNWKEWLGIALVVLGILSYTVTHFGWWSKASISFMIVWFVVTVLYVLLRKRWL